MERQVSVLPTKRTLACQASIAESSSVPWDFEIETFNEREQKLANYIPVFAMLPLVVIFPDDNLLHKPEALRRQLQNLRAADIYRIWWMYGGALWKARLQSIRTQVPTETCSKWFTKKASRCRPSCHSTSAVATSAMM